MDEIFEQFEMPEFDINSQIPSVDAENVINSMLGETNE